MNIDSYRRFVESKRRQHQPVGFEPRPIPTSCFEHQQVIIRWACRLGRCAVFADTGLGKTLMQLIWAREVARHTSGQVLILTPLAVKEQTIAEAARFKIDLDGITVTNYQRLHQIDVTEYAGVVLDESSILKNVDGRTRTALIDAFARTRYRLACTATPAPNDFTEMGNHAEFLGICSRAEMLAEFFVHDGGSTQDWRIKGHAVAEFWRWVATWAVMIRKPSDFGIDDDRYDLPPLRISDVVVPLPELAAKQGTLFTVDATTLSEQREARRASIEPRCRAVADLVASAPAGDQWLIWCELNDESDALVRMIPDAIEIAGRHDEDTKASRMVGFSNGTVRILVTKPAIAGFGMNWQACHRMAFVGATHSYEQWYQAVRRCWRFGQQRAVEVAMARTDADGAIAMNLRRKARAAEEMASQMLQLVGDTQMESLYGRRPGKPIQTRMTVEVPGWIS